MTHWFSEQTTVGVKVSSTGSVILGVDTSGVPIMGSTVTSATSVVAAGNNAFIKVRTADGTNLWISARTSAI